MKKRMISACLMVALLFSSALPVYAASSEMTAAADALYQKGLFNGKGMDANGNPIYDLDAAPTRHEAVTMLVALLGKTEEAKAGNWKTPFTDVAAWAKPAVGYAYANGLAAGTSATTFGGNQKISATQYLTYVLRALGYEAGVDFQWNKAWELSDKIGLTDGRYNENTKQFTRGDVAWISYRSLSCEKKEVFSFAIPEETEVQKADYKRSQNALNRVNQISDLSKNSLTWDQARALVGQDLETVKKHVKTIKDCMLYMSASGYGNASGDMRIKDGKIVWHFNVSPEVVFERGEGNCGGTSALVAYLLEGDYDEVGFVGMSGKIHEGGHVINYIKEKDSCYMLDINSYGSVRYFSEGHGKDFDQTVKNFLSGYPKPYMMAYTYTTKEYGDAPIGWADEPTNYLIEGFADDIHIVYETPEEGYVYEFIKVSPKALDKIIHVKTNN